MIYFKCVLVVQVKFCTAQKPSVSTARSDIMFWTYTLNCKVPNQSLRCEADFLNKQNLKLLVFQNQLNTRRYTLWSCEKHILSKYCIGWTFEAEKGWKIQSPGHQWWTKKYWLNHFPLSDGELSSEVLVFSLHHLWHRRNGKTCLRKFIWMKVVNPNT
jgi:hypothetical protein